MPASCLGGVALGQHRHGAGGGGDDDPNDVADVPHSGATGGFMSNGSSYEQNNTNRPNLEPLIGAARVTRGECPLSA